MERVVRVLVVDDSAYVRKTVTQILKRSGTVEVVGAAHDGEEALEMVEQLKPDVVTLDLIMPGMDGVAFLREQMARRPLPVVVLSIASESGELALEALDAGATDFVQKPTALATERVMEIADDLISKVRVAASVRLEQLQRVPVPAPVGPAKTRGGWTNQADILVMGTSTGGPQALRRIIPELPADLPVPVAIVLHMPVGYTELYAQKLDEITPLKVVEARSGDILRPGMVFLAPAGRHLSFRRLASGDVSVHLSARPFDSLHRPSVDVMFQSAAEVYGQRVLGVVMTGMGEDGLHGAAWIKSQAGLVYTEAEETCVVYGMPRAVEQAGLSDRQVPLHELVPAILEVI